MGLFHQLFNTMFIGVIVILAFAFPVFILPVALLYGLNYLCKERPETEEQRLDRLETERFIKEYEQKKEAN